MGSEWASTGIDSLQEMAYNKDGGGSGLVLRLVFKTSLTA